MAKYLNLTGLQTLWTKIKAVFAPKENGVYYVPGTSGYANWSANTYYAVGANVVNPSGECWTCKTAHTSGSSWSSTNWNRISAVALTGTIDGVTALYAGLKIAYRFQVLGGEGSTTLNVNNLGAKTITRGTGAFYRWTIGRNGVAILVYDGSAWRFGDYDSNDQYVLPDAYCSTAAGTQAKAATSIGFSYSRHNNIPFRIYFTNANTYNGNLTLNVNSNGAKPLWINGSASSSSNKTIAVGVYWCYYDGTQFQLWTDKSIWNYKYRGDGSSLTETFNAASSRADIASGDSNATIFGKIARWLGDLKALAFKDKVGVGDVESGTYGISISGNAATATGPGDTSESSIESGDSLVIRKTDNRFSRVAFLNQASYLALTKDGQWRPIANLAQLMAIQRLSNENVYNFRIPYANYAPNSNVVILEFGSASTSMRGKFILSVTDTGNIELYYPLGAGLNDLLDGGSILSVSHSAYTIQGQTTVKVESPSVEYSNSLSMSGTKGFATVPHSSRYRSFGHVFMKSVAMATASMQILITIDLNYDCNAGSSSVFLYGYAKVENLQGFEP